MEEHFLYISFTRKSFLQDLQGTRFSGDHTMLKKRYAYDFLQL